MNNKKSTKRALTSSILSLVLCIAMLIGSTFAWFTDSVTSAGNTIQSGTLNVDLVDAEGKSLEGKVLKFVDQDENDLWEPGCTYKLQEVYVANLGSLALKYEVAINGIIGDAKLLEAIEWTVTVDGEETKLADLKGDLLPNEKVGPIVLTGHMKEEAGNEYQGLNVEGISISVFATQLTAEFDSFDNQYDKDAVYADTYVTDAAGLADAIADGGIIALMDDIEVSSINIPKGVTATIKLNGNDISGTSTKDSGNQSAFVVKGDLTVEGTGTVSHIHTGANMGWNNLTAVFSVEGGTLSLGENVNVVNNGGSDMAYGVDVNTTLGVTTLNVNGATIYSTYTGIRIFNNHKTAKGIVNFNDGFIEGDNRDIWHQVSSANIPAENGIVNVVDGFNYTTEDTSYGGAKYFFSGYSVVADADKLADALAAGGDVIYAGSDLDIDKTLNVTGSLNITNATIDADAAGEIVVDGGTLTLGKGAVLSVDGEMPSGGVIRVIDDSKIVLAGAEISGCDNNGTGVLINVAAGATMVIEDGTVISGNAVAGSGNTPYALIKVCGELIMNGGEITNNEFAHKALISIEGGKFVMNSGSISNNTYTGTGATAVFYFFGGTSKFEMNGGTIADNNLGANSNSAVFNTSAINTDNVLVVNGGTVNADKFAYIRDFNSVSIASAANVSGSVYSFWNGTTKDVNDIKQ